MCADATLQFMVESHSATIAIFGCPLRLPRLTDLAQLDSAQVCLRNVNRHCKEIPGIYRWLQPVAANKTAFTPLRSWCTYERDILCIPLVCRATNRKSQYFSKLPALFCSLRQTLRLDETQPTLTLVNRWTTTASTVRTRELKREIVDVYVEDFPLHKGDGTVSKKRCWWPRRSRRPRRGWRLRRLRRYIAPMTSGLFGEILLRGVGSAERDATYSRGDRPRTGRSPGSLDVSEVV